MPTFSFSFFFPPPETCPGKKKGTCVAVVVGGGGGWRAEGWGVIFPLLELTMFSPTTILSELRKVLGVKNF